MEKLAIHGGTPVKNNPFPAWPVYNEAEEKALMEVLKSRQWWRTPGTRTQQFEQNFARYHQAKHGVAVTNGTAALEVVMTALGIGPGDEVIIPDSTFVATASAVLFAGAMPALADILPDTFCVDPDKVEAAINHRTKAIVAVHLAGHPADMDRMHEIAKKHNLYLIEDSSHSHGGEWKGHKVGALGDVGTFSFQQSKLMTAGEGGIIVTNDDQIEKFARSVHDCGRMPGKWFYDHFIYGSNYRLSEWQGAILDQQLLRLKDQTAVRTKNAAYLNEKLSQIEGITPQKLDPRVTCHPQYCYIFHYDSRAFAGVPTGRFINAINAEGIPNQASYPPIHALDVFKSGEYKKRLLPDHAKEAEAYITAEYPQSDRCFLETVWLPQPVLLGSQEDMDRIVEAVLKIQRNAASLKEN